MAKVKYLEMKWAPSFHLDYLKICHFDFRGWVTMHYSGEIIFKKSQHNLWSLIHLEPTSFLNTLEIW